MQEGQRIQSRRQQVVHFDIRQGAVAKQVGEILLRILHEHVQAVQSAQLATAGREQTDQMGMRKSRRGVPMGQLRLGQGRNQGDQLERGLRKIERRRLGQEDATVV